MLEAALNTKLRRDVVSIILLYACSSGGVCFPIINFGWIKHIWNVRNYIHGIFWTTEAILFLYISVQESGDDEYHGEHSDTEDEVDSDFDIDEGDEPDSDQEEDAPRRKSRVVTKAYKVKILHYCIDSLISRRML